MSITEKRLTEIQARLNAATDGPWAAWTDQDGTPHMAGMLMMGVAAGVIPPGETWVEGPDVNNPIAHTYTPEDRTFITHARDDVPDLLAEVHRLRDELAKAREVNDEKVERAARALAAHWTDMHTNEALGRQKVLARHALYAALGGGDDA